jgi:hypothetical protein
MKYILAVAPHSALRTICLAMFQEASPQERQGSALFSLYIGNHTRYGACYVATKACCYKEDINDFWQQTRENSFHNLLLL